MQLSRPVLFSSILLVLCALPALMTRDLSSVNELNYVTIAAEALARGDFFFFGEASFAFPPLPPLYFWLCMAGCLIEGGQASVFLLSVNLAVCCLMLWVLEQSFGRHLLGNDHDGTVALVLALPCLVCAVFLAQPAFLSAALTVMSTAILAQRAQAVLALEDRRPHAAALPVLLCALMLLSSPYALLIPLAVLALMLALKLKLQLFFKILGLRTLICVILAGLLWFALTVMDGGYEYARALFVSVPLKYFKGEAGHGGPAWYPVWTFLLISLPLGPAALYAAFRVCLHARLQANVMFLAALLLPLVCVSCLMLPKAKSELLLLPALPTLSYLIMYYLHEMRLRDQLIRILLTLGMLPFGTLLLIWYYLNDELRMLNATAIICALLFITLFTALSAVRLFYSGVGLGVRTFAWGILITVMTLGFAMPTVNSYLSPLPAVRKAAVLAKESGVARLCVIGIPKPWTLNLAGGNLKIVDSDLSGILSGECAGSYRLLGRSALRDHSELLNLKHGGGAFVIGDSVLLEPAGGKRRQRYWY